MDIHVVKVPEGSGEEAFARGLIATGDYQYVEPDWLVYPLGGTPCDPWFAQQWHLRKIEGPAAWSRWTGDGSITIAFVDTGVDLTHPDLAPLLVPGLNSASNLTQAQGGDVSDINGHGTNVAGAACAMGNNGFEVCGVGWSVPVMPIRATNSPSGGAFFSDIIYGAAWAAYSGARVVSVSYGGIESSSVEPTAEAITNNYGGLLVWGAGNSATSLNFDRPYTTVVGSTDQNDSLAGDSNFGPAIDVVAPGVGIYAPARGGGCAWCSGTSFSTPIASGVLALMWSASPSMTPIQAMNQFYQSCDDLGAPGRDNTFGWGRVNAARAVGSVLPALGSDVDLYPATVPQSRAPELIATYFRVGSVDSPVSSWTQIGGAARAADIAFRLGAGKTFHGAPPPVNLGAIFAGAISIPASGTYTFTAESIDGARVYVDGRLVADNSGAHADRWRAGSVGLTQGNHQFRCEYATANGPITLIVRMRGPGVTDQNVPRESFSHVIGS